MLYEVKDGQSIFDIVLNTVGSIEDTYLLLTSNPQIDSVDYDFNSNPNIVIDFVAPNSITPIVLSVNKNTNATTSSVTGREGQSLFDIALMTTGSIDTMFSDLLIPNGIGEADTQDITGFLFNFKITDIVDVLVYEHFKKSNYVINTGFQALRQQVLGTENGNYLVTEDGYLIAV